VHADANGEPDGSAGAAEAAHDSAEQTAGERAHAFGNSDGRLPSARENGDMQRSFDRITLPRERSSDGRQLPGFAGTFTNGVDEKIEVGWWHLAVDDDLELELSRRADESVRRLASVGDLECRLRRGRRRQTMFDECVIHVFEIYSRFHRSVSNIHEAMTGCLCRVS
jgi:hypothetical protein